MIRVLSTVLPSLALLISAGLLAAMPALAGPDDPSHLRDDPYAPQKALYDFNFANPGDGEVALGYLRNHLRALEEYGGAEGTKIVVVAHGNELHALSRHNRAQFPEIYDKLVELTKKGVAFHVCNNAARGRGYTPEDFYDVVTVVPAAVAEIAKFQNQGYSYMYAGWFPRVTREELAE